jgi:hypothetical protein
MIRNQIFRLAIKIYFFLRFCGEANRDRDAVEERWRSAGLVMREIKRYIDLEYFRQRDGDDDRKSEIDRQRRRKIFLRVKAGRERIFLKNKRLSKSGISRLRIPLRWRVRPGLMIGVCRGSGKGERRRRRARAHVGIHTDG